MPVQIILDGPRNVVVKATNTALEAGTLLDASTLDPPCTRLNIDRVWFTTEDIATIILEWEATVDVVVAVLHGQQDFCFDFFGGLTNDAGAGVTGNILYTASTSHTLVLHCTKHGIIG